MGFTPGKFGRVNIACKPRVVHTDHGKETQEKAGGLYPKTAPNVNARFRC